MTTSSHPLNVLMSIFGGGGCGGGDIDHRVGTAASSFVVESGFMNDQPEGNGHENMCDDRSQNDLPSTDVHAEAKNNRAKAEQ